MYVEFLSASGQEPSLCLVTAIYGVPAKDGGLFSFEKKAAQTNIYYGPTGHYGESFVTVAAPYADFMKYAAQEMQQDTTSIGVVRLHGPSFDRLIAR